MSADTFVNINTPKIVATASVGVDHICIPREKKNLITVLNTPKANAKSVAEYTIGCALTCSKRILEGRNLYRNGKNNKKLYQKPEDLYGKILGVIGAGNISLQIMEYGELFGMDVICWTPHPEMHPNVSSLNVKFVELNRLLEMADIISVNLPNNNETKNIISTKEIDRMKNNAIFISVSRKDTCNYIELLKKAEKYSGFYVCLDLDVSQEIINEMPDIENVIITPHIAGGTVNTRKRMFTEIAQQIVYLTGKE